MEFTLACNWDPPLIDQLDAKKVKGFFGQYTDDPFGDGRGSFLVPKVTKEEAEVFIKKAKARGFEFNYLVNGACLNNQEFIRNQFNVLMNHLEWVNSLNVETVTVSLPFLLNLIRKNFPRLKVCISSWAIIESANRAKYWEEMGADKLILQEHVNRSPSPPGPLWNPSPYTERNRSPNLRMRRKSGKEISSIPSGWELRKHLKRR